MNIAANLFYVRKDGLLFIQLKKDQFLEHPNLSSFFGKTIVQFPGMKIEGMCVGITQTGIILDEWNIIKTSIHGMNCRCSFIDDMNRGAN